QRVHRAADQAGLWRSALEGLRRRHHRWHRQRRRHDGARWKRRTSASADGLGSSVRDVALRRRRRHRGVLPVAMNAPFLSLLILLPIVGSLLVLTLGNGRDRLVRQVALAISLVTFVVSLVLWAKFDPTSADYQFQERHSWLPDFGISYHL